MDNSTELLTSATFISAVLTVILVTFKQIAPTIGKRIQSRLETSLKEEKAKAETEEAEDKLTIEAKSFLAETAKEHIDTYKNIAQQYQDEVKLLRQDILNSRVEQATLQAKNDAKLEEIQRVKTDYLEARSRLDEARVSLDSAQDRVDKMTTEMLELKQQVERMNNQISVLESRLLSEQQNSRVIEKRLESAEAELKVKDELLKESKIRNDRLSQDIRDLQRKLREYAAKLHVVETNMESANEALDTKELIAREYDDFSVTTQATKIDDVKKAVSEAKEDAIKPSDVKKPITKKILPVTTTVDTENSTSTTDVSTTTSTETIDLPVESKPENKSE